MRAIISRYLWVIVLTVWGGTLGYFYFSGRVSSYLHPSFHIWTLLSAVLLVLMALGLLFLPAGGDCCAGECVHPGKSLAGQAFNACVLVIPLVLATVISPGQFGLAAVQNRGLVQSVEQLPAYKPYQEPALPTEDGTVNDPANSQPSVDLGNYLKRDADGRIEAQSIDLLYAAMDSSMRQDFEDKSVSMIGQFLPAKTKNAKGDRFDLIRMYVMCCAADAKAVAVSVQTPEQPKLSEMSWVKITGKATFPIEGGKHVPVIEATSVTPCDPPEETFIY